jgi:hypothetical protein
MSVRAVGLFVQEFGDGSIGNYVSSTLDNREIKISDNREIYV